MNNRDKMNGFNIHQAILEYKKVYETSAIQPPAYRMTCKEHKMLVEYLKQFMLKTPFKEGKFISDPVQPTSMIAVYYGIYIEVVMIVDAYL